MRTHISKSKIHKSGTRSRIDDISSDASCTKAREGGTWAMRRNKRGRVKKSQSVR
ncbi:predicted protein [Botrytis cinerea T4]|uniref:Uncharacterized protein n=1 Tax=Botryotinia fuckeliana (strain T4) TaxID=999810 RepID=G2YM41_BOTF4|nr:predicted protein [Botrytis cinerea T4]